MRHHSRILSFGGGPRGNLRLPPAAVALGLLGALGACATSPPLQETTRFQQAFVAVDGVSQPLLDELAIAEREQGRDAARANAKRVAAGRARLVSGQTCGQPWRAAGAGEGFIGGFCVSDAGYFATIGDPPATRGFREALALVGEFSEALMALADGASAAATAAQLQQLARNAGDLGSALAASSGAAGMIGPAITGVAAALSPLIGELADRMSDAQERRVIVEAGGKVGTLILALRDAAPAMFDTLTQRSQNEIERADRPAPADIIRIEAYRATVADYVVLLDRLGAAWGQLLVAAGQPSNPASLTSLTQISAQIAADAAAIRRSLASMRRGGTPDSP